jgi:hypothetical protein
MLYEHSVTIFFGAKGPFKRRKTYKFGNRPQPRPYLWYMSPGLKAYRIKLGITIYINSSTFVVDPDSRSSAF